MKYFRIAGNYNGTTLGNYKLKDNYNGQNELDI